MARNVEGIMWDKKFPRLRKQCDVPIYVLYPSGVLPTGPLLNLNLSPNYFDFHIF